ncbi:hypothetical protein MSG28_004447 [Choristoneura fumiferana]|uniref:Uncharacterized protein n=2 Tax=Choristoneura fumiferana TaxID=7141 RepID=A0ACC0K651_CHOFU|nr:hypothetical protein MSG28_004447 [Choristoneura fumiferana]
MRARLGLALAPPASPPSPPRRAAARLRRGQFAAPLGQHLVAARADLPRVEMQALRAAFERGEDPLAHLQERLLRVAALPSDAEFVRRMRDLLAALPPASFDRI